MLVSKDTSLCISISAHPSNIGMAMHNAGYAAKDLDFIYKAFRVQDCAAAIAGVRALGIRGCSVSMPFKIMAIASIDEIDEAAAAIGAVNTIVNNRGTLRGYNTDWIGATASFAAVGLVPSDRVLILGAGGVARAILYSVSRLGCGAIAIAARRPSSVNEMRKIAPCEFVDWHDRESWNATIVVNASPVGMNPDANRMPVTEGFLETTRAVFDAVANPSETLLARTAKRIGLAVADGAEMSVRQAAAQFEYYTGVEAPIEVMRIAFLSSTKASY